MSAFSRPRAASSRNASPEPAARDVVRSIALAQEKGQAGVEAQNRGDFETAIIFYTSAISLRPESRTLVITLLINRATSLYALGQQQGYVGAFNSALEDVKKVLRLDPKHYKALGIRGNLHLARLEFEAAAYCFRTASESAPTEALRTSMLKEQQEAETLFYKMRSRRPPSRSPSVSASTSGSPSTYTRSQSRSTSSTQRTSQSSDRVLRGRSESRGRAKERQSFSGGTSLQSVSRKRPTVDHYEVLGLARSATEEQIKSARRKALLLYHPDRPNGDLDKYEAAQKASEVLCDPEAKLQYDLDLLL